MPGRRQARKARSSTSESEDDSSSGADRARAEARKRRRIVKKTSFSSGDEEFWGQQRWQDSASDVSWRTGTDDRAMVNDDMACSISTSADSKASNDKASGSEAAKKPRKPPAASVDMQKRRYLSKAACREYALPAVTLTNRDDAHKAVGWTLQSPDAPWRTTRMAKCDVAEVAEDSPAAKAGIRVGMRLTHVDGVPVAWDCQVLDAIPDGRPFRVGAVCGSDSSSDEEDDEEESEERTADSQTDATPRAGIGKGKGPGPPAAAAAVEEEPKRFSTAVFLPQFLKPAAKKPGPGRALTAAAAAAWQKRQLKESKEVALATTDSLAEIMRKIEKADAHRAEQIRLLKARRRLQDRRIAVHASAKVQGGCCFMSSDGPSPFAVYRTQKAELKAYAKSFRGVSDEGAVVSAGPGAWKYREPYTRLHYNSKPAFRAIRAASVLANAYLEALALGSKVKSDEELCAQLKAHLSEAGDHPVLDGRIAALSTVPGPDSNDSDEDTIDEYPAITARDWFDIVSRFAEVAAPFCFKQCNS
ncbi:hypothetical protein DIPPA_09329 [Diplonema papillatum]|nr:hypothetical protein DIPPA_09329 [Diplonema papillatum]